MNAQLARLCKHLPLPWPGALLCVVTLGLYLPAFCWLIYDHWYRYDGSLLGVIPLALSLFWLRQLLREFPQTEAAPSPGGIAMLTLGLWLLLAGWSAEASAIMGWSGAVVIPALAWIYGGRTGLKLAWFPAFCLAMAFPIPGLVEHHLGLQARLWSAALAKGVLAIGGLAVERSGTFLTTSGGVELDVGNACSGVKTMHVFLVAALVLLQPLRLYPRRFFALLPAFFLAAVLANGVRVAALVVIAAKLDPKWLEGASHELAGLVFFLLTFLPLAWAVSRWGNRVVAAQTGEAVAGDTVRPSLAKALLAHGTLLLLSLGFLIGQSVRQHEYLVVEPPELPFLLGQWAGREELLAAHEIEFYGVSGLRKRLYASPDGQRVEYVSNTAPVSREGLHEPTGCFTSLGWHVLARKETVIQSAGVTLPAVILKMERPSSGIRQLALFWFMDGRGRVLPGEPELTWHAFKRRLALQPEEVWTLHGLAVAVDGEAWEPALVTAEGLGANLYQALKNDR
jgi:exosortase